MTKKCIFCGKKAQLKTNEHIIPTWLLELTGDPNRKGYFGIDLTKDPDKDDVVPEDMIRTYSFNNFVFPACEECNNEFGKLEDEVKGDMMNLARDVPVSKENLTLILDWFDKIRLGLWLGFRYLNKNYLGITPRFYIIQRMRTADRLLLIYKLTDFENGINFFGVEDPAFSFLPSCFGFRMNNFFFINISRPRLLAKKLGLPYFKKSDYKKIQTNILGNESIKSISRVVQNSSMKPGTGRPKSSLVPREFSDGCVEIGQPIINPVVFNVFSDKYTGTEYIKNFFEQDNEGKVVVKNDNSRSDKDSILLSPEEELNGDEVFELIEGVLRYQIRKLKEEKDLLSGELQEFNLEDQYKGAIEVNKTKIRLLKNSDLFR